MASPATITRPWYSHSDISAFRQGLVHVLRRYIEFIKILPPSSSRFYILVILAVRQMAILDQKGDPAIIGAYFIRCGIVLLAASI